MSRTRRTPLSIAALLGGLLCLAAGPVAAQTWQIDYDPVLGTLPSAQGWTHFVNDPLPDDGLDESNYVVALGTLAQGDTGGPNSDPANVQWYEVTPPGFDFDDGVIVFDLRLKILSSTYTATSPPSAGFGVVVRDEAGQYVTLFIGSTDLMLWGTTAVQTSYDSTIAYSDYQLRLDRLGASISVDGVPLATLDRDKFRNVFNVSPPIAYLGDIHASEFSSSQLQSFGISRFNPPAAQVRNYHFDTQYSATDSSSTKSLTVNCPSPSKALGGGVSTSGAFGSVGITESLPSGGPPTTGWTGSAREVVDTGETWQLRVDVICGEISGYENLSDSEPHTTDAQQVAERDCPEGRKVVVGGGAGFSGADLRQTLTSSTVFVPFTEFAFDWGVSAKDYGAATSSAPWGLEIETICSDAVSLEPMMNETAQDASSPKQVPLLCPSGKVPISGGATILGWGSGEPALRASRPIDGAPATPPIGWFAEAEVDTAPNWSLETTLYCAPIADPTVSKNGLVGRWRGSDAGGDSWDIGHGTLENGATTAPSFLGQGQAFSLDGASEQWVQIPSLIPGAGDFINGFGPKYDLYPEASFTVDAWFQTSTLPPAATSAAIVNLYEFGGLNGLGTNLSFWGLSLDDQGRPLGAFRDEDAIPTGPTLVGPGPDNLTDGRPHHVALIRDSEARLAHLYVDGVLQNTETVNISINDGPLEPASPAFPDPVSIGVVRVLNSTELASEFTGLIDDVKYYDRALTAEEIQNTAGCGVPLVPRTLNLDAALFGSPADQRHGLCVFLEAGIYSATLVTPALDAAARLTAWSPSPTSSWSTVYVIEPEVDGSAVGGFPTSSPTPQQAFDATAIKQTDFTLSVDQRVHFSTVDGEVLDNRGGVSVRIEYVPEPNSVLMLASGTALLGFLSRRRSRREALT